MPPTCKSTWTKVDGVFLSETDQTVSTRTIRLFLSPLPSLVLHRLFISRLHTPYFISTIFPTPLACSLSYPSSFCRSVLSYSHCATSYMHTWLAFFRYVSRHLRAKNWHHFLKTVAFLIAWKSGAILFTFSIFFYVSRFSHSFTIHRFHTDPHIEFFFYPSIFSSPHSPPLVLLIFMAFPSFYAFKIIQFGRTDWIVWTTIWNQCWGYASVHRASDSSLDTMHDYNHNKNLIQKYKM